MSTSEASQTPPAGATPSESRAFPIYPILIAAFPILSLYSNNLENVRGQDIVRPLELSLLAACALWVVIASATRHLRKGAAAASLLSLAFFSYGHLANLFGPGQGALRSLAVAGAGFVVVGLLVLILRSHDSFRPWTRVANYVSLFLLAPSCLTIGLWMANRRQVADIGRAQQQRAAADLAIVREPIRPISATESAALPDIYYIILDAYAGADNLQRYFGYDNTPFIHELEKRGFWLPRRSQSNYPQTWFSLPSSLNMGYLDEVRTDERAGQSLFEVLRRRVDENAVAQVLRRHGYHYVYLWTGTDQTRVDTADLRLDDIRAATSNFEEQTLGLTAATASGKARTADFDRHRRYILSGFERLATAPSLPYPKFVLAHFSAPHPPFVFGPNGEAVNPEGRYTEDDGNYLLRSISKEQYRRGYVAQLEFMNRRTMETIDAILRTSRRPPIIVLQGDHGSRMNVDWQSQEKTDLREPYSILNAYLAPPAVRSRLYDGITPVNSFRAILDGLFNADYKMLPDRQYFSEAGNDLFFNDVTGKTSP